MSILTPINAGNIIKIKITIQSNKHKRKIKFELNNIKSN